MPRTTKAVSGDEGAKSKATKGKQQPATETAAPDPAVVTAVKLQPLKTMLEPREKFPLATPADIAKFFKVAQAGKLPKAVLQARDAILAAGTKELDAQNLPTVLGKVAYNSLANNFRTNMQPAVKDEYA